MNVRQIVLPIHFAFTLLACNGPRATTTSAPTAPPTEQAVAPAASAPPPVGAPSSLPPQSYQWTFDSDPVGAPPPGFEFGRTGSGTPGRWQVRAEAGAPSGPAVLAQVDADTTDFRFPVAVAKGVSLRDVRVQVRCKPVSGTVDRACGLVARYRDQDNYYLTRANALEGNVRLYIVREGKRSQLASWSGQIMSGSWYSYRFDLQGDHLQVYWEGKRVIDHHDSTFNDAGSIGVWTKADSVTYFDDLTAEPLS
jgi:hypothetical protein